MSDSTLLALLLLCACGGDSPTGGGGGGGDFVVNVGTATLTSAADSVQITATYNGAPAAFLKLTVDSEVRGDATLPVVSSTALARNTIRAAGPGSATILASSGPDRTARITVSVAPSGPTIFTAWTTGHGNGADTTVLRGVQLQALSGNAVQLDGITAALFSQSPTELRLPAARSAISCSPTSTAVPLTVAGATLSPDVRVYPPGGADVTLAVGAWRTLTPSEARCIRLPAATAEYALAYADLGSIEQSRTAYSPPPWSTFSVSLADQTLSGSIAVAVHAATSPAPSSRFVADQTHRRADWHAAEGHRSSSQMMTGSNLAECSDESFLDISALFWCRSKPWAVGDTMILRRPNSATIDTVRATVYAVYGGVFVFSAIDGDNSAEFVRFKATIDSVMPAVLQHTVPLLRAVFGPTDPTTSERAGQLLTVIGDFQHGSVGNGCCQNAGGPWSAVALGSTLVAPRAEMFYLMSHELTHAYQHRWMHGSRPVGASPFWSGSYWGLEGGADLIAYEAVRRYAGLPFAGNVATETFLTQPGLGEPLTQELAVKGSIGEGYSQAAAFQRDLVARYVAAGATTSEAFREVARGSLEDWFGLDFEGVARPGLAQRMRTRLGSAWEPGEGFLLYLLSQAADDRLESPVLQNPFWRDAWRYFGETGDSNREFRAGQGTSYSVSRQRMSGGTWRLVQTGTRAAFEARSPLADVRFAIARIR